jgi:hypothetical protein
LLTAPTVVCSTTYYPALRIEYLAYFSHENTRDSNTMTGVHMPLLDTSSTDNNKTTTTTSAI